MSMKAETELLEDLKFEDLEEQYRAMADLGISYIQGFHFSKPLPEQEFLRFLSEKNRAVIG